MVAPATTTAIRRGTLFCRTPGSPRCPRPPLPWRKNRRLAAAGGNTRFRPTVFQNRRTHANGKLVDPDATEFGNDEVPEFVERHNHAQNENCKDDLYHNTPFSM